MKWLCPMMLLVIMAMEMTLTVQVEVQTVSEQANDESDVLESSKEIEVAVSSHSEKKTPSYSKWGSWSKCQAGWKTRRRHCIRSQICGDALRIEVARCKGSHELRQAIHEKKIRTQHRGKHLHIHTTERRQMQVVDDVQKRFRGFSPWSDWSNCSRRCTTIRRRHCQRRYICGKKIVRQSAYCYLEGSYCQNWIRSRMQRRKDPGEHAHRHCQRRYICGKKIVRQSAYCYLEGSYCQNWIRSRMQRRKDPDFQAVETMPPPAVAIHPEDTRVVRTAAPECGKLGRFRGTAAARLRYRMRDMVRIIGGRPSPPGKWPWQVAVLNRYKEAFCGGTLVALRWVVTAAHCVRRRLYVRLGEHDLFLRNHGEIEMRVTEAVVHPRYDPDTVVNDVALLRLPSPARPDLGHGIACLPQARPALPPHTSCVILGWGKKRPTDIHGTRILHEAQVSTIQQGSCRRSYWQYAITDDMVCAGRGRRDSCAGDSGGPLLCRAADLKYYLQGITSFGDGCGKRGKYGIYTRTAGYVSWMHEVMSKKYFD